jgi:polar amino acid transport system substrate-binding protein
MLQCALALAATPALAAEPLTLAFSELEPWKTTDGTNYGGAYTEIVREMARRIGAPLNIVACPLKRCLVMLEHGEADIIIGIQASPERSEYIHFLRTPYRQRASDKVFYVRKGKGDSIRSYEDLRSLRVGIKSGAMNFPRFSEDPDVKKSEAKDLATNFKKLMLGRLDAVIASEDQGEAAISQLHLRDQVEQARFRNPDPTGPRSIGLSKKSPFAKRTEAFETAMTEMVKDGTLTKLFRRYYFDAYQIPPHSLSGL